MAIAVTLLGAALLAPQADAALLAPKSKCKGQLKANHKPGVQERAMRCLHNYARVRAGLKPLARSDALFRSAGRKAKDIKNCEFSHFACGKDPFLYIMAEGCFTTAGENIAAGTANQSPRKIMRGWLRSSGHRANILRGSFTHAGFGLAKGPGAQEPFIRRHWVAHFGKPC